MKYFLCNLCTVQLLLQIVQIIILELQEKEEYLPSFHPLMAQSPVLVLRETWNGWGGGKKRAMEVSRNLRGVCTIVKSSRLIAFISILIILDQCGQHVVSGTGKGFSVIYLGGLSLP